MKKILLIILASILLFNFWCLKKKEQTPPVKEIQSEIVIPAPMPQDSSQDVQTWDNQDQLSSWQALTWTDTPVLQSTWSISADAWLTWESKEAVDEIEKELEQIFKELQDE